MTDHLNFHTRFSPAEFDAEYNLRAGRPDYEVTVIPGWIENSEKARDNLDCSLDIRYGTGDRQKLDVFRCDDPAAPTLVYFHGGYWQRGDKSIYSFIAAPFVQVGISVIVVGYDLCPDVTITRISEEAREAIAYIWAHGEALGINRDRITVMGHSAGGHITQMMMATDWSAFGDGLPADLIKAGMPVSPLSYLEPVRLTEALNAGIRMDAAEAEAESPMTNHPPATDAPQLVVVGGAETSEFHRQARMYAEAYQTETRDIGLYIVPDVDHFDELNVLVDPNSPFFKKSCDMIHAKGPNQ
jgi:arylformamidase